MPSPALLDDVDGVALGARRHPSRPALIDVDGSPVTYRELDDGANRLAHAWRAHGISPGERVALWLGNSATYLIVYLACLRVDAVVVQVNHRHTAAEARYQLESSGAEVLVFDGSVAERVADLGIPLRLAVSADASHALGDQVAYDDLVAGSSTAPLERRLGAGALAVLGYTSGTTGHPKGVKLTRESIRALGETNMVSCRYAMQSVQVFGFSLSFTAGIPAHVLPHLRVGGTTVLLPAWDTERLVDEVERRRATFTLLPSPPIPEFCELVERRPERVASLVSVLHSTARAPEAHLERLVGAIGPRLVEGWGMTENSGGLMTATTARDYTDQRERVFSTAGRPVPGAEIRVVDDDGARLTEDGDTVGLLEVRTGSLARGYWNDEAAERAAFRDGWFATGDLGAIDADGYVYLVDRRSDLIVSGGMNVYPSEVERVLSESPDVDVCAVVGAPHERWGRTPVAFVVAHDPSTMDVTRLLEFARSRLASYKLPTQVRVVSALPTNAGGKVVRRSLASLLEEDG